MKLFYVGLVGVLAAGAVADSRVDLSPYATVDMQQFLFGNGFPLGGSSLNIGGVDFNIATLNGQAGTTGALERPSNSGLTTTISGLNIAINAPTSLYTLVDEQFGRDGSYLGFITVKGSKGESSTIQLVSGANVGNNWTAGTPINLTDPSTQVAYIRNGQIVNTVDLETMAYCRQELSLSGSFIGDSVTSITFSAFNNGDVNLGEAVFAAATFDQTGKCCCPEPASMAALGISALAFIRRKRSK